MRSRRVISSVTWVVAAGHVRPRWAERSSWVGAASLALGVLTLGVGLIVA